MFADDEWLAGLKVGDEVVVHSGGIGNVGRLRKVGRLTKTQILVDDQPYRRDTGDRIPRERWNRAYIVEPTEAVRLQIKRAAAIYWLRNMKWDALSDDQLFAIADILPRDKETP